MARQAKGSGRIYRDGDHWRAALLIGRDPNTGKPMVKSARTRTKQEAVAALREMTVKHGTGKLITTERKSLATFLDQWLESHVKPSRQPQTYRLYEWVIRLHILPLLGKKLITAITRKDVQALLAMKAKQGVAVRGEKAKAETPRTLSASTLRNIKAVLHAALEDARRDGILAVNPAELVEVPKKDRKKVDTWLVPDQATKLLAAVQGKELGDLFTFILHTGTRIGEAAGLRWQDVKLGENPTATIAGQLQRFPGEGLQWMPGTKTNQIRTLALTETAATMLKELKARQLLEEISDPDGIVFLNADGNRVDHKFAGARLKSYCRQAGVPEVSPHKLRHTAASLMLAATGDLHAVQKTLGHAQVALTANLYGHASAETLRPAMQKLDEIYRSERG